MRALWPFFLIAFLQGLSTNLMQRGTYFFTTDRLGFTDAANLSLALVYGLLYVFGARASHPVASRLGERPMLRLLLAALAGLYLLLVFQPTGAAIFLVAPVIALATALKWPVIESFVGAGHLPVNASRSVGYFSLSWALSVPVSLLLAGPIIADWPTGFFLAAAAFCTLSLGIALLGRTRPEHLPEDHPHRPDESSLRRVGALLHSARWLMVVNIAATFVLAPLLPTIFRRLGVHVSWATGLSASLDVMRLAAFATMWAWTGWHGRAWPLVGALALMPLGFFLALLGGNLPTVLIGEMIFGFVSGVIYYAALYYAIVRENAAVSAGGGHEALIGLGFVAGPAFGLLGVYLEPLLGSRTFGSLTALAPMFLLCAFASLRALRKIPSPLADE